MDKVQTSLVAVGVMYAALFAVIATYMALGADGMRAILLH